jgi:hypothetical protein
LRFCPFENCARSDQCLHEAEHPSVFYLPNQTELLLVPREVPMTTEICPHSSPPPSYREPEIA